MGLLDSIAGQVAGAMGAQGTAGGQDVMGMIGQLINNPQMGGLQGLVQAFHDKGLGAIVSSWVGTGGNLPISAEQITSVLGHGSLQEMAQKVGLPVEGLSAQLSSMLPQVIDKLTPNGSLPDGDLLSKGMGMLSGLLK
jgi:uncharacterized protein YidB (DUF937 family)